MVSLLFNCIHHRCPMSLDNVFASCKDDRHPCERNVRPNQHGFRPSPAGPDRRAAGPGRSFASARLCATEPVPPMTRPRGRRLLSTLATAPLLRVGRPCRPGGPGTVGLSGRDAGASRARGGPATHRTQTCKPHRHAGNRVRPPLAVAVRVAPAPECGLPRAAPQWRGPCPAPSGRFGHPPVLDRAQEERPAYVGMRARCRAGASTRSPRRHPPGSAMAG
jgi:hypothetical protein